MDLAALNLIAEKHIRTALEEDLNHGDVSAAAVVPASAQATVELIAKQEGVIAGLDVFERTFHLLDPAVALVSRSVSCSHAFRVMRSSCSPLNEPRSTTCSA